MSVIESIKSPIWWQRVQWVLDPVQLMETASQPTFRIFQKITKADMNLA